MEHLGDRSPGTSAPSRGRGRSDCACVVVPQSCPRLTPTGAAHVRRGRREARDDRRRVEVEASDRTELVSRLFGALVRAQSRGLRALAATVALRPLIGPVRRERPRRRRGPRESLVGSLVDFPSSIGQVPAGGLEAQEHCSAHRWDERQRRTPDERVSWFGSSLGRSASKWIPGHVSPAARSGLVAVSDQGTRRARRTSRPAPSWSSNVAARRGLARADLVQRDDITTSSVCRSAVRLLATLLATCSPW